jgi:hypothetical protein
MTECVFIHAQFPGWARLPFGRFNILALRGAYSDRLGYECRFDGRKLYVEAEWVGDGP